MGTTDTATSETNMNNNTTTDAANTASNTNNTTK